MARWPVIAMPVYVCIHRDVQRSGGHLAEHIKGIPRGGVGVVVCMLQWLLTEDSKERLITHTH